MTPFTLTAIVVGFAGILTFAALLTRLAGPDPYDLDALHQARSSKAIERRRRQAGALAVSVLAVLFLVAATWPQGTPA